jgi:hypothetical protein
MCEWASPGRRHMGIVVSGRSARITWVAPKSPAVDLTEYGRPVGLPRSDFYAPDPPGQNQAHLDRARHAASTRQTG